MANAQIYTGPTTGSGSSSTQQRNARTLASNNANNTFGSKMFSNLNIPSGNVGSIFQPGGTGNTVGVDTSNGGYDYYWYDSNAGGLDDPYDPGGGYPTGGGGGGRGGGGGGGAKPINWGVMGQAMGYRPQEFTWQNYTPEQYKGTGFYDFNGGQYDRMRRGVREGLAADLAAGNTAYGDARGELERYQNPFAGRQYSQNPEMSQAMQRMMSANNVQADPMERARGTQADAAFGNVLALLAGNAGQRQASELRALGGDQRRFGESLNSEGRGMNLAVDMKEAAARDQYEKDKWQYGEQIALQNYNARTQAGMYNNQGANTVGQANTQALNDVTGGNMGLILDLIASGEVPPEMVTARAAGFPAGGEA